MSQSGGIHQNPSHREGNNHLLRLVRHYESSLKSGHPFYFDVEDLEEIADYYIADGRASDGEAVVELGLKMHPCSSGLLLRRVRVLMVSGQLQRALRLLDSMPDASYVSSDVDALLTKGEILVRLSRVFEAEQVFEECVEAVRIGGNLEEYIDTCLTVSDIYIADSLYTRAIAYIRRVLEEDGDCQDALSELAFCHAQTGEMEQSLEASERLLSLDPFSVEGWFNIGQTYGSLEQYDKAIEAYGYAVAIDPTDSGAWLQKGLVEMRLGRYADAIESLREFIPLCKKEKDEEGWCQGMVCLSECHEQSGEIDEALRLHHEVLSHYPEYVPALIGKGLCLMEKDEMEEAMDCFKNATRIEPDNVLSINYYGETLTHLGRYDEAIHAFNCALETAPESEDVLRNLGRLYLDVGRYEESIVIYNRLLRATQDTDNKYQSFVFLAIAYFKLGDYDFSEQYIRRALEINAQNATQVFFGACPEAMTQFARLFEEKKTDEHDRGETAN